jgi:hypothetical protein
VALGDKVPDHLDGRHYKGGRSSVVRTGRLYPGEIPGTHFQRLSRPQGTWFCRKEPRKKSPVTPPGIDPGTVRLVAQRLNHYATPGPSISIRRLISSESLPLIFIPTFLSSTLYNSNYWKCCKTAQTIIYLCFFGL